MSGARSTSANALPAALPALGAMALNTIDEAPRWRVVACVTRLETSSSNCSDKSSTAFKPVWYDSSEIAAASNTTTPTNGTSSAARREENIRVIVPISGEVT